MLILNTLASLALVSTIKRNEPEKIYLIFDNGG